MPVATNWDDLIDQIYDKMVQATKEATDQSYKDLKVNTDFFYTIGPPKVYKRTGRLGYVAPTNDGIIEGWPVMVAGRIRMNTDFTYASGASALNVYNWAEEHSHGIIGVPGWWAATEIDMELNMKDKFKDYFR